MLITRFARCLAVCGIIVLSFSCVALAKEKAQPSTDAGSVVAGVIEAYGGKDAITAVKSVYASGEVNAKMRKDSGTYTRYMERDMKLRVELEYAKSPELRILNGKEGWRGDCKGLIEKALGFWYQSMAYQYKQLDLPYGLLTGRYHVKLAGEAVVNGRHAEILSLSDDEGTRMYVYIDSKDRRIVKVTGFLIVNGKPVDLTAEFTDFRKVDGAILPFKITNYSQGYKIGETTIKEYVVNKPMDASLFRPKKGEVSPAPALDQSSVHQGGCTN